MLPLLMMIEPEERTVPEPETTLNQEVKELENLGVWEEGAPENITEKAEVEYDFPVTMNRQVEFYLDFLFYHNTNYYCYFNIHL